MSLAVGRTKAQIGPTISNNSTIQLDNLFGKAYFKIYADKMNESKPILSDEPSSSQIVETLLLMGLLFFLPLLLIIFLCLISRRNRNIHKKLARQLHHKNSRRESIVVGKMNTVSVHGTRRPTEQNLTLEQI